MGENNITYGTNPVFYPLGDIERPRNSETGVFIMNTQESNNGLYFIVGMLVVIVALIGFFYMGGADTTNMENIEPAAGLEEGMDQSSSSFRVDIDENGVTGTTTQQSQE